MTKEIFILNFETNKEKLRFITVVGNIPEKSLVEICGISIEKSHNLLGILWIKVNAAKRMFVELTKEELRCLTLYFGRNPTELTPLSPVHRNFLLLARKAGFEVEKPIWEKPKNTITFSNAELKIIKKLFKYAGWRNFLLDISPEENKTAKELWKKFIKLFT